MTTSLEKRSKQTEANKRWAANNKERAKYLSDRSRSRSFITKQATEEDLLALRNMIDERINELTLP